MRYHFWQFLLNQEGQPINGASVSVFLAGTSTPANIFTSEDLTTPVSIAPQLITTSNGFFEFWIADEEDSILGYSRGTKFKIAWERDGISSGIVDYIDVFPLVEGVDEFDNSSTYKNKLISNALANIFYTHTNHDVVFNGLPIHGLTNVDLSQNDETYNKLVNNFLAKGWQDHKNNNLQSILITNDPNSPHNLQPVSPYVEDATFNKVLNNTIAKGWEDHRNYIFETTSISGSLSGNTAHGLNAVDPSLSDAIYNKIVSNKDFYDIHSRFSNSTFTQVITAWTDEGGGVYSFNIIHDLNQDYPSVTCWNTDTKKVLMLTEIESISENEVKIKAGTNPNAIVKIFGYF